jgi:protein-cysteine N-palmitoyltransferase HHAT
VNTLAVFTFVAFWHDISLKLLAWGWLVTLFILPEVIARMIMPPKKVRLLRYKINIQWNSWPGYRHVCAIAAAGNVLMMMIANLIGFCVGLDGIMDLLRGIVGSYYGTSLISNVC